MNYTKEKWEVTESGLISKPFEVTGCNACVEFKHDAKLISKAPEMYEAIKLIVEDWNLPQSKISLGEKMQILKSLLKQIEKNEN